MTPTARDWPLVSCIMPTYNRRHFVPRAIRSFLRQDFPHKELVIVDDGAEAVGDLVPVDPRVRYVRLERRATVGAKRNLACEQAAGPLIAHWDDDDWHAPRRLRCQVEALLHAGADLCGLRTLLFYDASHGRAWRYDYPDGHRPWLSGSSLLYTRNYWMAHRFPEIDVGEDSQFVWSADPRRLAALDDFTIHVGIIHGQNVAPKQTDGAWWRPHPVEEVRQILGEDWEADGPVATAMPPQPAADGARVEPGAPPGPPPIRNVFACLVHENPECVVDLVRNLRHLDPDSTVLLYNGSCEPESPQRRLPVRPPRGRAASFAAADALGTAARLRDRLHAIRPGASPVRHAHDRRFRPARAAAGILDSAGGLAGGGARRGDARATRPSSRGRGRASSPRRVAHAEIDLWRPFLRRFPDGESKFVHWGFWPSTVFTADAARDLVRLFDEDEQLQQSSGTPRSGPRRRWSCRRWSRSWAIEWRPTRAATTS